MSHDVSTRTSYNTAHFYWSIRARQIARNYAETGIERDDMGYDFYGYDRDGYDRNGLDKDWYNRQGIHLFAEPRWDVFLASIDPNYTPRPPEDVMRRYLDMINNQK